MQTTTFAKLGIAPFRFRRPSPRVDQEPSASPRQTRQSDRQQPTPETGRSISPSSEIHIHHLGGAVARVPDEATAFGQRGAPYLLNIVARWTDPATDDAQIGWARDLYASAEPFSTGGTYVNYLSAGDDRFEAAYGPDNYQRLARLKETWDPTNVFRLNQNIRPAGLVRA